MPPGKRRTRNIRQFDNQLQYELRERGLAKAAPRTISDEDWCAILNAVTNKMSKSPAVVFYRNDVEDGRTPVIDPVERADKLFRFLKRTIPAHIPHIKSINAVLTGDSIWIRNIDAQPPEREGQDGVPDPENPAPAPDGHGDIGDDELAELEAEAEAEGGSPDSEQELDPDKMTEEQRQEYEAELAPQPQPGSPQSESEFAKWWRTLAKLRGYCREAASHGLPIDDLASYRPAVMGAKMIREGITADACADAATAHWPDDAREELGISTVLPEHVVEPVPGKHPALAYVVTLMRARVPVMLHGGAGVGKTTIAREIAELYDLPFGMVSMTAGLSTTALTGSVNLQGFVTRPCVDTFSNGGVFLFDEMDAADPNLLLVCNTMLANNEFQSPVTGERHIRHDSWHPMAAVNTLNGATTAYTGRSRLDHATMDRWRMGRVRMGFDVTLALDYAVQELRA